jgi:hypothetical protein
MVGTAKRGLVGLGFSADPASKMICRDGCLPGKSAESVSTLSAQAYVPRVEPAEFSPREHWTAPVTRNVSRERINGQRRHARRQVMYDDRRLPNRCTRFPLCHSPDVQEEARVTSWVPVCTTPPDAKE